MPRDLAPFAGALLHRNQWVALGISEHRLSGPEFRPAFPGFHTPRHAPASLNALCHVLQRRVVPGAVISHSTAAVLLGIPIPWQHDDGIGLLGSGLGPLDTSSPQRHPGIVPSQLVADDDPEGFHGQPEFPTLHASIPALGATRTRSCRGVILHRRRPGTTVIVGGVEVSAPVEVIRELAEDLPLWDVVAAIDMLVGPASPVRGICLEDLGENAASSRNRRGVPRMRAALRLARLGVESPGESYARLLVTRAGFPEPVPNLPVLAAGRWRRLDNGWSLWKVGLEYDGAWRRLSRRAWLDDETRRDDLASAGWLLRRQTAEDARQPLPFLLRVRTAMLERGGPTPTPAQLAEAVILLHAEPPAMHLRLGRTARRQRE